MITTDNIVKGSFPTSAGHRVEFEGKVIRLYSIQNVVPMVEVDTPDGPMHSQVADATVVGTWKAPKREAKVMGKRTKVRGNAITEGMTILVSERDDWGQEGSYLYPDHRVTMAQAVKVTAEPKAVMRTTPGSRRSTRWYVIPTDAGNVEVPSGQTITVVSND